MGVSKEQLNEFYIYLEKMGIELLPYQKELIKENLDKKDAYVIYPPSVGRTDFRMLEKIVRTVYLEGENDGARKN